MKSPCHSETAQTLFANDKGLLAIDGSNPTCSGSFAAVIPQRVGDDGRVTVAVCPINSVAGAICVLQEMCPILYRHVLTDDALQSDPEGW